MTRGAARVARSSDAFVLRRVEYGEADLIVTLFTETEGRVVALARSARKSRRRFAGSLEPFFTIHTRFEERPGAEIVTLTHAEITRARTGLLSDLGRMELAGKALNWVRAAAPPRTPEPAVFERLSRLLDRLNDTSLPHLELELAEAGLALLTAFGWSLELERCVRCGKACPEGSSAFIDVSRGGLVCRACGGGRMRLEPGQRLRLARAAAGTSSALEPADASAALTLVERVFAAHAGIESSP